jgi:hypothetical protein
MVVIGGMGRCTARSAPWRWCWRRTTCRRWSATAGCCGSGVVFILCVYFFPTGIVGRLRRR